MDELRALMRRFPAGVAVVTVDADDERLGLTVGSLVSLSLEPPLVGISLARAAALYELLREAAGSGSACSPATRKRLAQHFARGVPPIVLWHGIGSRGRTHGRRSSPARSAGSSAAT